MIENGAKEIIEVIIDEDFLKLISDKVDFWSRNITKDEELNDKIIKKSIYQEAITSLNVYVHKNIISKSIKQIWQDRESNRHTHN